MDTPAGCLSFDAPQNRRGENHGIRLCALGGRDPVPLQHSYLDGGGAKCNLTERRPPHHRRAPGRGVELRRVYYAERGLGIVFHGVEKDGLESWASNELFERLPGSVLGMTEVESSSRQGDRYTRAKSV